jgi:hypothetical protein
MDARTPPADKPAAQRHLPPVEAPSASFLLQLFLIPLVIVTIIVMVWLLFSWLAHMGSDPQDLVRDIGRMNNSSWQAAYNLAELLRKPQNDKLKDDRALAQELAATLQKLRTTRPDRQREVDAARDENRRAEASAAFNNRLKLEEFLCLALGEFRVRDGLPELVEAAEPVNDPAAFRVREAAIWSLAIKAQQSKGAKLAEDEDVMRVLLAASHERHDGADRAAYDGLRSSAAYALGMVGGDEALERLSQMLDDGNANTRYNAATGLARHGDARALPVIGEMLDPDNEQGLEDPEARDSKDLATGRAWKRVQVMLNAIRASQQLTKLNKSADYGPLVEQLAALQKADVEQAIKLSARNLELELTQGQQSSNP